MSDKIKNVASKVGVGTKKVAKFWTQNSKKLTLIMIFLISVIVDEVALNNILYTENALFESNVFKAILVSVGVIITHDIKGLVNRFLDKFTK
jgi:hypothetical protein